MNPRYTIGAFVALTTITVILVVGGVAFGTFLLFQKASGELGSYTDEHGDITVSLSDPSQPDALEWKEYTSDRLGLTLRLPTGWDVEELSDFRLGVSVGGERNPSAPQYDLWVDFEENKNDDLLGKSNYQRVGETTEGYVLHTYTEVNDFLNTTNKVIVLTGADGEAVTFRFDQHSEFAETFYGVAAEAVLELSGEQLGEPEELSFEELMNTSTWKVFESEELGVRFRYPGSWRIESSETIDVVSFKLIAGKSTYQMLMATENFVPHGIDGSPELSLLVHGLPGIENSSPVCNLEKHRDSMSFLYISNDKSGERYGETYSNLSAALLGNINTGNVRKILMTETLHLQEYEDKFSSCEGVSDSINADFAETKSFFYEISQSISAL